MYSLLLQSQRGVEMKVEFRKWLGISGVLVLLSLGLISQESSGFTYIIPDTNQEIFYDSVTAMEPPDPGDPFFGQDAEYQGLQQAYLNNGDGTVTDLVTGLMWQQNAADEKMSWDEAMAGADTCSTGGYADWRLPDIKELYSLIQFSGTDPSSGSTVNLVPFIDTDYFQFEYGDTLSGERLIDAQYWSSTEYTGETMGGNETSFGVNFADGRIKGYPSQELGPPEQTFFMTSFVRYVRGTESCENQFVDNGDGTVTDLATNLMWQQSDDGTGRNWEESLVYAEILTTGGYSDWRLPNAHELQSIVDYTKSMQGTGTAAIDPVFSCTQITDEGGNPNYGFYWTGTTHAGSGPEYPGGWAAYVCFGEALGWMTTPDSTLVLDDVHGAGAQRSDPKCGDPDDYPWGNGPQGDVVRIYNFVRCVRDVDGTGIEGTETMAPPELSVTGSNPFSRTVTMECVLPAATPVLIDVFDASGRLVSTLADDTFSSGAHQFCWTPAESICSGIYLMRLSTGYGLSTAKVVFSMNR